MKNRFFCKKVFIFPLLPSCKIQKYAIILSKCPNIPYSPTGSQKSPSSL